MDVGNIITMEDPFDLWTTVLNRKKDEYTMINLMKELKSKYGLKWIGFSRNRADISKSMYEVINEKSFTYFLMKFNKDVELYED